MQAARLKLRRVSVASENPTKHSLKSLLTGSVSSLGLAQLAVTGSEEDWVPDVRPVRSSLPHIGFSARNDDWNSVQKSILSMFQQKPLSGKEMFNLYAKVRLLAKSEIGPFIYDYYKNQLLKKGMRILRDSVSREADLLVSLGLVWNNFYQEVLPVVQLVLHPVTVKDLSIRQVTLVAFRDNVLLKCGVDGALDQLSGDPPPPIQQMLLVLQSVMETTPPGDNYLSLERLVGRVVRPYLGYLGLYDGGTEPVVRASHTAVVRRKSDKQTGESRPRPRSLQMLPTPTDGTTPSPTATPSPGYSSATLPAFHSSSSSAGRRHSHQGHVHVRQTSTPSMSGTLSPVVEQDHTPEMQRRSDRRHSVCVT